MNNQPNLMFVGAFPSKDSPIFGGNVTACRILLESTLPKRVNLILIDSTQISNPPPSFPVRLVLAARRLFIFLRCFHQSHPDAVLLFTSKGASLVEKGVMAWYSMRKGIPALLFPRGGALVDACERSRITRWWVRIAMGGATKILCQGTAWQEFVTDCLKRPRVDAPIVQNWSATPDFLDIGNQRTWVDGKPVRLLFVGSVDRTKGVLDLLSACTRLVDDRDFTLDFVGEGGVMTVAREQVQLLGLGDRVTFRGCLTGNDLHRAFADSDIFVLPSWAEGLPNALIEAMAARLAIVTTPVGNITDVIVNGQNGLLVPPRDVDALVHALMRVMDDQHLRKRLADHAYELAAEQFSPEVAVDRIVAIVNEVVLRCD